MNILKKLRIYLDTSVISYLKQDDTLEKMQDTLKLWQDIKQSKYDVYLSDTTLEEITQCKQPKQDIMLQYLSEIQYTTLSSNDEIETLAEQIINLGILSKKSFDDCIHIATAIVISCDYIVSWNFKHMVNVKTIRGVRAIANLQGYKNIDIIQPTMLIQDEE